MLCMRPPQEGWLWTWVATQPMICPSGHTDVSRNTHVVFTTTPVTRPQAGILIPGTEEGKREEETEPASA